MSTPTTHGLLVLGDLEGQCGGEARAAASAGGVDAGDALGVLVGVYGVQVAKQCVAGAEAVAVDAADVGRGGNTRDCGRMSKALLRHELLATAENHRVRHPHERLAVAPNLQSARR